MGQRLQKLNLDFSGFSRAASRRVDAAQIAAQGDAALGSGIASGLNAIAGGIATKKANARADSLRAEENARSDKIRAEGYARADAVRMSERAERLADEQRRADRASFSDAQKNVETLSQQMAQAQALGVDPAVLQPLVEQMRRHQNTMRVLSDRSPDAVRAMSAPAVPPMPEAPVRTVPLSKSMDDVARARTRPTSGPMDEALTQAALSPDLFRGGGGAPAAAPGAAGPAAPAPVDRLSEALSRAEALRMQQKQLNDEAGKAKDFTIRNALYGRATIVAQQAKQEEMLADAEKDRREKDAKAREAAVTLAQKNAEKEAEQRKRDEAATAEYVREFDVDLLGAVLPEADARGRIAKRRDERAQEQADLARREQRDAAEAKAKADRQFKEEGRADAGVNRDADAAERTIEQKITDAEQDRGAAVSMANAVTGNPMATPEEKAEAARRLSAAEEAVKRARSRRGQGLPSIPENVPPPATRPSAIRSWITGGG